MGQMISSCIHPQASVSPFYADCQKLKPQEQHDAFYIRTHHQEIRIPFELGKQQILFSYKLLNKSNCYVAIKINTPNPKKFCVTPNPLLVLSPRSTCDIQVTMQAQEEAPPDMQCKDTFVIQHILARPGKIMKDITPEMFEKDSGYKVKEVKVVYVAPPKPSSPVQEGSAKDLSPQASVFSDKARELISKLTEERNSVIEQNQRLQEELNLLRREA